MILGLDLYDTLTKYPTRFRELAYHVIDGGGTVVIISAVKTGHRGKALRDGEKYQLGVVHVVEYEEYHQVPKLKYDKCVELGVQLFFDDRKDTVNYLNKRHLLALLVP